LNGSENREQRIRRLIRFLNENFNSVSIGITMVSILVVLLISTPAYLAWTAQSARITLLEERNEDLKESTDWKLPATIQSLNEVSERVRLETDEREKLESLATENETLRSDNDKLKDSVATLEERVGSLEAELKKSVASTDTFELSEGQSADLIENRVTMGVATIYSNYAQVNLNNEQQSLDVGNSTTFPYAEQECTITLKEIIYDSSPKKAVFSFGCME
jgi:regulator of replication initiation timing